MKNKEKIVFLLPSKGKLLKPSLKLLKKVGIKFNYVERRYVYKVNGNMKIILCRSYDIPYLLEKGYGDIGITGIDMKEERSSDIKELLNLSFGKTKIFLGINSDIEVRKNKIHNRLLIATEFPNIAKKYLKKYKPRIVKIRGAGEAWPNLDKKFFIVDLYTTGETSKLNDINPLMTVMQSSARLFCNKEFYRNNREIVSDFVQKFKEAIK